jgi:hypothetical protein
MAKVQQKAVEPQMNDWNWQKSENNRNPSSRAARSGLFGFHDFPQPFCSVEFSDVTSNDVINTAYTYWTIKSVVETPSSILGMQTEYHE